MHYFFRLPGIQELGVAKLRCRVKEYLRGLFQGLKNLDTPREKSMCLAHLGPWAQCPSLLLPCDRTPCLGGVGRKPKCGGPRTRCCCSKQLQQAGASAWELATGADPPLGSDLDPLGLEGSVFAAVRHCVSLEE